MVGFVHKRLSRYAENYTLTIRKIMDNKPVITEIQAEEKLLAVLDTEEGKDLGDAVYELAHDLYRKQIQKIEENNTIIGEDGKPVKTSDSDGVVGELWYDGAYETFFDKVYANLVEFLTRKN